MVNNGLIVEYIYFFILLVFTLEQCLSKKSYNEKSKQISFCIKKSKTIDSILNVGRNKPKIIKSF